MKKILFVLSLLLLTSCEEPTLKNYKVELNTGEVYHITATGYWYHLRDSRIEFYNDKGIFFNVKYVIVENNY